MIIKTETIVSFDPVKEWKAMRDFERDHPDWRKSESTVMVSFIKTDTVSAEVRGEADE